MKLKNKTDFLMNKHKGVRKGRAMNIYFPNQSFTLQKRMSYFSKRSKDYSLTNEEGKQILNLVISSQQSCKNQNQTPKNNIT